MPERRFSFRKSFFRRREPTQSVSHGQFRRGPPPLTQPPSQRTAPALRTPRSTQVLSQSSHMSSLVKVTRAVVNDPGLTSVVSGRVWRPRNPLVSLFFSYRINPPLSGGIAVQYSTAYTHHTARALIRYTVITKFEIKRLVNQLSTQARPPSPLSVRPARSAQRCRQVPSAVAQWASSSAAG